MSQKARILRIWLCLAGSMSVGAAVLSWLEAASPHAQVPLAAELLTANVDRAVTDLGSAPRGWLGIELLDLARQPDRLTLAARQPQDDVHFVIAPTGDVLTRSAWRDQRALDQNCYIRIGLAGASATDVVAVQRRTVRALIHALVSADTMGVLAGDLPEIRDLTRKGGFVANSAWGTLADAVNGGPL